MSRCLSRVSCVIRPHEEQQGFNHEYVIFQLNNLIEDPEILEEKWAKLSNPFDGKYKKAPAKKKFVYPLEPCLDVAYKVPKEPLDGPSKKTWLDHPELRDPFKASTPYWQYLRQLDREEKRLVLQLTQRSFGRRETLPWDDALRLPDNAYNNVRNRWIDQGIWKNKWDKKPPKKEDVWGFQNQAPEQPQRTSTHVGKASTSQPTVHDTEGSRPYRQFLYQMALERRWVEAEVDFWAPNEVVDIERTAYHSLKLNWIEDNLWNKKWGHFFPGLTWVCEEPEGGFEDLSDDGMSTPGYYCDLDSSPEPASPSKNASLPNQHSLSEGPASLRAPQEEEISRPDPGASNAGCSKAKRRRGSEDEDVEPVAKRSKLAEAPPPEAPPSDGLYDTVDAAAETCSPRPLKVPPAASSSRKSLAPGRVGKRGTRPSQPLTARRRARIKAKAEAKAETKETIGSGKNILPSC